MVYETIKCPLCSESEPVKRYDRAKNGTQRYRCYACKKSFLTAYTYEGHKPEVKRLISQMAMNGSGVRDTARTLRTSQNTVMSHFKKK
ncbi:MAG: IS1 family transposase [Lewinellaceae bacterium]|jgi:transposase|nr:IS1 family transposase [Lewinellaceae bacterium]